VVWRGDKPRLSGDEAVRRTSPLVDVWKCYAVCCVLCAVGVATQMALNDNYIRVL
jgi:hypothetical protein